MGTATTYSVGAYFASEKSVLTLPRDGANGKVVIWCHGYGADGNLGPTNPGAAGQDLIITAIAQAGYAVFAADLGGTSTWGNDTAISRIGSALTYLTGLGYSPAKIALVGVSMGTPAAFAYAHANPTKVAAILGLIPVSDINDMVTNNRGGLAAAVNAAYSGGWSSPTYAATHDPLTIAQNGLAVPFAAWNGSADTTAVPSTVAALVAAMAGQQSVISNGDHSEATISRAPSQDVLDFLTAHY